MGIRIAENFEEKKYADLEKLKPGDTFENDEDLLFLVINNVWDDEDDDDEKCKWTAVDLSTGKTSSIEDDKRIRLVDLVVSKE